MKPGSGGPAFRRDEAERRAYIPAMDIKPAPFIPPAPKPRTKPPSTLEMIRIVYRNPLELWGEPSYNEPWISVTGIGGPLVIANDPGLIRHVLVDNAKNYKMATVRQMILRPILRDGLLTAEGDVWKRSRKSMAPVFTPRHIFGFAKPMLDRSLDFVTRYEEVDTIDISHDMTQLTYDILAETLFSGEIAGTPGGFNAEIDRLFETMGRVDPLDLLRAPEWLPRITRLRGRKTMAYFRKIVTDTVAMRKERIARDPKAAPEDFLTLLLRAEGPDGLSRAEIEDIYDMRAAVAEMHKALKPGGVVLLTVPGISQVDRGEWGSTWYWALTPAAATRLFAEAFGYENVEVESHGNVYAATTFLQGLALEEVDRRKLDIADPAYPVVVTVRAQKQG
jgi:hypothetical protein